ncbi:hypothetical protein FB45DRAFT_861164 [Roridomyces roridus]|uniref:Uncharacterized protein n=1 Tax=Roridomyces roridus TaxID=1738132 RepID=A0AAD7C9Y2_9AGAR|nr:hypothetical protein FB45DRAFT_861164 [Roridomyces roridus]
MFRARLAAARAPHFPSPSPSQEAADQLIHDTGLIPPVGSDAIKKSPECMEERQMQDSIGIKCRAMCSKSYLGIGTGKPAGIWGSTRTRTRGGCVPVPAGTGARDHHRRLKQHLGLHHGANAWIGFNLHAVGRARWVWVVHELEAAGYMGRASFDVRRDLRLAGGGSFQAGNGAGIYVMHLLLHRCPTPPPDKMVKICVHSFWEAACAPPPVPSSEPPSGHVAEFQLILVRRPARSEPKTSTGGGGGGVTEMPVIPNTINLGDFNI